MPYGSSSHLDVFSPYPWHSIYTFGQHKLQCKSAQYFILIFSVHATLYLYVNAKSYIMHDITIFFMSSTHLNRNSFKSKTVEFKAFQAHRIPRVLKTLSLWIIGNNQFKWTGNQMDWYGLFNITAPSTHGPMVPWSPLYSLSPFFRDHFELTQAIYFPFYIHDNNEKRKQSFISPITKTIKNW